MHIVAPSILAANFANLQSDIEMCNSTACQWLHLDVMDGVFVPNISFGMPVIKAIRKHTTKTLDIHLMIVDPGRYVNEFRDCGANVLTVHLEACTHLHRVVQSIKAAGMKAGVALNPHTPVHLLEDIISDVDLICMMSVNPGFGGQKFIENTYNKITQARELIAEKKSSALIEIDGGVDLNNYKKLIDTGATVLVAGNTVFSAQDPAETIKTLLM
ncbi:MAG: ribulose-phosphate 3-epimerase [Bacteroidetes bacterium]|nr:ribulose-phosphate 3-epimerase [Bacteroidota bacterium]